MVTQTFNSALLIVLVALLVGVMLVIFNINATLSQNIENGNKIDMTLQALQKEQNNTDMRALVILQALQLEQKDAKDRALVILNNLTQEQDVVKTHHNTMKQHFDSMINQHSESMEAIISAHNKTQQ